MNHLTCCVVNCKNNGTNNKKCKFYRFPTAFHKLEQRRRWIAAVKRKNPDGSPWTPKPHNLICSAHFIGNAKSDAQASPSYVPTIFPAVYQKRKVNETTATNRFERYMRRRNGVKIAPPVISQKKSDAVEKNHRIQRTKQEHPVDSVTNNNSFICNRYTYKSGHCDVEIQTKIVNNTRLTFAGMTSVKNDRQLLHLAGVKFDTFHFLLKKMTARDKHKRSWKNDEYMSKENRLLMFLIRMKSSLPFSAMSVLFSVDRMTVSRLFFHVLHILTDVTANLVLWPKKDLAQKCLHYNKTNTLETNDENVILRKYS